MASPLVTYTQGVTFGVSNGPTYGGTQTVPPPSGGTGTENYRNYPFVLCLNTATTTIDASGFLVANWLAMGFTMQVDPVQTGTPTPTQLANAQVTIHLVDGLSGGATDYTITIGVGNSVSWIVIPATLVHNVTSITVHGDSVVDCDVAGLLVLTA